MPSSTIELDQVLDCLERVGVMLETDRAFPSVAGLMVSEPIKGSWWAHSMANDIYMLSRGLIRHPDTILLKLLSGKTTYVHRRLWPELVAIGTAQESWQTRALPASARAMLKKVERQGSLRLDELRGADKARATATDARILESRLLVIGDEVHTASGAHVKRIETWEHWSWRTGFQLPILPVYETARDALELIVNGLNQEFGAAVTLPWQRKAARKRTMAIA